MLPVAEDVGKTPESDIVRDGVVSDVTTVADTIISDDGDSISSGIIKI